MAYEYHYTGYGYPSRKEIETKAKAKGFTHSFWATECCSLYEHLYNGDTVVVYNNYNNMPLTLKMDAEKYGKEIE